MCGTLLKTISLTIMHFFYSDNTVDCTLWDPLSVKFLDAYNSHNDAAPFVFIMRHTRIKEAQGRHQIDYYTN
jgi:hypothetical protein